MTICYYLFIRKRERENNYQQHEEHAYKKTKYDWLVNSEVC